MKETRAYKHLKKTHTAVHWIRIESSTSEGAYDINGCLKNEVWIEQKQIKKPKRKDTLIKIKIRPSQIIWGVQRRRAGGRTFFAIMVGRELYIIRGELTAMLMNGVTYQKLKEIQFPIEKIFE